MTNKGIQAKDIPNFMVEKKPEGNVDWVWQYYLARGYNQAITEQGTRRLTSDRERLAKLLKKKLYFEDIESGYDMADAIINVDPSIIVCGEE